MKNTNKKGFTIVELVIVIAVIAILAAVLIPTFVGLVNKANMSADQQAVRQMNQALAIHEAENGKPETFEQAMAVLSEAGYNAEDWHPLSKGYAMYWYATDNMCILYNNNENSSVYPEKYKDVVANALASGSLFTPVVDEESLCELLGNGANITLGNDITVTTMQRLSGGFKAGGPWMYAGSLDGGNKIYTVYIEDTEAFAGVWAYGKATGIRNITLVSNIKSAICLQNIANAFVLENVTVDATGTGVHIEGCDNVVIKDSTITSKNENGFKCAIFAGKGSTVTIEGGTYEAENAILTGGSQNKAGTKYTTITVNGGTFIGNLAIAAKDKLVINGGTFSVNPSAFINSETHTVTESNGTWTVTAK